MVKLISENNILFDVEASNSEEVINILADVMEKDGRLTDKAGFVRDVLGRESVASTAIGYSIATPHSKSDSVSQSTVAFVKLKDNIMWDNKESVKYIFMVGVPASDDGEQHLEILANLFRKISTEEFREDLNSIKTPAEFIKLTGLR